MFEATSRSGPLPSSVAVLRVSEKAAIVDSENRAKAQEFYDKMQLSEEEARSLEWLMLNPGRIGVTWDGYLKALAWYVDQCRFHDVHNWIRDLIGYGSYAYNGMVRYSGNALVDSLRIAFTSCLRGLPDNRSIISKEHSYRFISVALGQKDPGEGCLKPKPVNDKPFYRKF